MNLLECLYFSYFLYFDMLEFQGCSVRNNNELRDDRGCFE